MELYNKDTFSEDILPVVIVGKSCQYIFVVHEHSQLLMHIYMHNACKTILFLFCCFFLIVICVLDCTSQSNLKCCIAAKVQN